MYDSTRSTGVGFLVLVLSLSGVSLFSPRSFVSSLLRLISSSLLRTVKARVGLFSLENSIFQSFVGEPITDPSMTTRGGESYLARE